MKTKRRRKVPAKGRALYDECVRVSKQGRPYVYGGGHTKPLDKITAHEGLDCSGSVSLALHKTGMFAHPTAWVASNFPQWGEPGKGKVFTVWCRAGAKGTAHVWVQFHGIGRYWRFDTSPWRDGSSGARMRMLPRPTLNFTPRHWPGL